MNKTVASPILAFFCLDEATNFPHPKVQDEDMIPLIGTWYHASTYVWITSPHITEYDLTHYRTCHIAWFQIRHFDISQNMSLWHIWAFVTLTYSGTWLNVKIWQLAECDLTHLVTLTYLGICHIDIFGQLSHWHILRVPTLTYFGSRHIDIFHAPKFILTYSFVMCSWLQNTSWSLYKIWLAQWNHYLPPSHLCRVKCHSGFIFLMTHWRRSCDQVTSTVLRILVAVSIDQQLSPEPSQSRKGAAHTGNEGPLAIPILLYKEKWNTKPTPTAYHLQLRVGLNEFYQNSY